MSPSEALSPQAGISCEEPGALGVHGSLAAQMLLLSQSDTKGLKQHPPELLQLVLRKITKNSDSNRIKLSTHCRHCEINYGNN